LGLRMERSVGTSRAFFPVVFGAGYIGATWLAGLYSVCGGVYETGRYTWCIGRKIPLRLNRSVLDRNSRDKKLTAMTARPSMTVLRSRGLGALDHVTR
jgi:hypothetical protein